MDSIYFEDPLGLLIELASYRFEPPFGFMHADVLLEAHKLRVERGDYNIAEDHLADAIETLVTRSRASLSEDRSPAGPLRLGGGTHGHAHAEHPQAERQQPDRSDLRARRGARLRGAGRLGEDDGAGVPPEVPGPPDADARGGGAAAGHARRELRDHGLPVQQARPRPVLSDRAGRAGDGRQRDVLLDRHVLSAAHAGHVPGARLRPVPGRGRHLRTRTTR